VSARVFSDPAQLNQLSWQAPTMGFKLTYSDGQEDDYDDDTKWAVEDGVLKMGREVGVWTVLVSPSHWATIEVAQDKDKDKDKGQDKDKDDNDKGDGLDQDRD
jgi:hypothetical protein